MASLDPPEGAPRVMMEVTVIKAEILRKGMWFFTHHDQQVPMRAENVTLERDKHGRKVVVIDQKGEVHTFRPDSDDTVQVVV